MRIIVAVDRNWAIGKDNRLLASVPEDMRFFKETTTGNVVVMGRKTLESFPGKRPLKNRVNIVLTHDPDYTAEGAVIVHEIGELLRTLKDYADREIYVIGGDSIYKQLLTACDRAYVTRLDAAFEADSWFPDLDKDEEWRMSEEGEPREHEGLVYRFCQYERIFKEKLL